MIKKVFTVCCFLVICSTSVAFADVPDPSGRPRPRPRPLRPELSMIYGIDRITYHSLDEYDDNKVAADVFYSAPKMSKITFSVELENGDVFYSGEEFCADGNGCFTVFMPKPEEAASLAILKTNCRLRHIETRYGFKEVDYDVFSDSCEERLLIERD